MVVGYLGWVEQGLGVNYNLDIPLSARFCCGRWKLGRIGSADGQDVGTLKSMSTLPMFETTSPTLYFAKNLNFPIRQEKHQIPSLSAESDHSGGDRNRTRLRPQRGRFPADEAVDPGGNCIKISLPGKTILGDSFQEKMTSQRPWARS